MPLAGALVEKLKWLRRWHSHADSNLLHLIISTWKKCGSPHFLGIGESLSYIKGPWVAIRDLVWVSFLLLELYLGWAFCCVRLPSLSWQWMTPAIGCELRYVRVLCKQWTAVRRCEHPQSSPHLPVGRCATFIFLGRYSLLWFCMCRLWVSTPKQTIKLGWERSAFYLNNHVCFLLNELFWHWLLSFVKLLKLEYNSGILWLEIVFFFFNLFLNCEIKKS